MKLVLAEAEHRRLDVPLENPRGGGGIAVRAHRALGARDVRGGFGVEKNDILAAIGVGRLERPSTAARRRVGGDADATGSGSGSRRVLLVLLLLGVAQIVVERVDDDGLRGGTNGGGVWTGDIAVSRERPRQVRLARQRGFEEERVGAQVSVQHRVPRHVAGLAPLQVRVARVRHVARPVGKAASERGGRIRGNGAVRDGGERTTRHRCDATPRGAHRSIGSVCARARRDSRTGRKPPRESDARSWSMARGGRAKVDARRASSNRRRARERPARRGVEWRRVRDRLPLVLIRTKVLYPTCPSRAFPAG